MSRSGTLAALTLAALLGVLSLSSATTLPQRVSTLIAAMPPKAKVGTRRANQGACRGGVLPVTVMTGGRPGSWPSAFPDPRSITIAPGKPNPRSCIHYEVRWKG